MTYSVSAPQKPVAGTITPPASKSISNRALIIHALSFSDMPIHNIAKCDDTDVMVKVLSSNDNHFDIGAAGTAMRFLTAFLSKIVGEWTLTGSERMKQRPIGILVDALRKVGAQIDYVEKEGFPPLQIHGSALMGGEIELEGSVSSQYISALLMVAPTMKKGLTLKLTDKIISRPYILLTLKMMEEFGVKSSWEGNVIKIKPQEYKPIDFTVESDWSAASYWYQICALSDRDAEIKLTGLHQISHQGDAEVAHIFEKLGIGTRFENGLTTLFHNGTVVEKLDYDFVNQPDLAQTFVVTCCCLGVPFRFSGLQSLKIKETDRIAALINECAKLGYKLSETASGVLEWDGNHTQREETVSIATYKDHRMAMAFAPASLKLGAIKIEDPSVVSKSYPLYWDNLKSVGFGIEEI
ncbi:MAG TPA: 3-phosphoshikimate 1-carboxyvinyltransferase [Paludibacteraceae bacterium]|nr:3-phosphoshikimate 1-carboxyvinyltransferase [Paludibacteraceae bacterium]HOU69228.1 3-phosphoshikimate 1-carboxyvinyltransferase [Paludibacteraceae bacterium]HPH63876.1 3-phosphoshikimate 1-carboxyvinyltransferase [Paludibacteraceae bacterium]HQF50986.1 3-phosphoshikimate 1-carboxyvinyltransferase [Paludibacteraceae bacterium]HQJ89547.1 3-phosphoshikimate 1-carboxyvinyltransferase [Paludibacteraceae bacterium]